MPFSALIGDDVFISTQVDDETWNRLRTASKNGTLKMYWSGLPAIARTSKLGLRHFAHKSGVLPDENLYSPETSEHFCPIPREIIGVIGIKILKLIHYF